MGKAEDMLAKAKAIQDNKENRARLIRAYLKLSQEEFGKIILEDLINFCGQNRTSVCEQEFCNDQTNFSEGKRRVWLHINSLISEGKNGLD